MQFTTPTNKETNAVCVCVCEVNGITVDFSKDFGLNYPGTISVAPYLGSIYGA